MTICFVVICKLWYPRRRICNKFVRCSLSLIFHHVTVAGFSWRCSTLAPVGICNCLEELTSQYARFLEVSNAFLNSISSLSVCVSVTGSSDTVICVPICFSLFSFVLLFVYFLFLKFKNAILNDEVSAMDGCCTHFVFHTVICPIIPTTVYKLTTAMPSQTGLPLCRPDVEASKLTERSGCFCTTGLNKADRKLLFEDRISV